MCFNPLHLIDKLRGSKTCTRMANCVHCFQIRAQRRSWTPELSNRIQLLQHHVHNPVRPAYGQKQVPTRSAAESHFLPSTSATGIWVKRRRQGAQDPQEQRRQCAQDWDGLGGVLGSPRVFFLLLPIQLLTESECSLGQDSNPLTPAWCQGPLSALAL